MVKLIEAWVAPGGFKFVRFDKDILALEETKVVYNEAKLSAKLQKETEKNSAVIGIVDGGAIFITLYDNGKFSARIWASGQTISGTYVVT